MNKINDLYTVFWEDYVNNRPIAGGFFYEPLLRQYDLDCSLTSLKELDLLLSKVRQDIHGKAIGVVTHSIKEKQAYYLKSKDFQKFVFFVGFYTVRVLAQVYKSEPQYFTQQQIQKIETTFSSDSFLQSIAVNFVNENKRQYLAKTSVANLNHPWLFFIFEPIINRIFSSFSNKISPIQTSLILSDSVYQSVIQRIPEQVVQNLLKKEENVALVATQKNELTNSLHSNAIRSNEEIREEVILKKRSTSTLNKDAINNKIKANNLTVNSPNTKASKNSPPADRSENNTITTHLTSDASPSSEITNNVSHNRNKDSLDNPRIGIVDSNVLKNKKAAQLTCNDIKTRDREYTEAWHDLKNLTVVQTIQAEEYNQNQTLLFKFDSHVDNLHIKTDELTLNSQQNTTLQAAVFTLKELAIAGNTSAMLHLGLYQLEGRWLTLNKKEAVINIQTAANNKDMRAMKLLSKLYYQGDAVKQDVSLGKYWLEKSADCGHPEAILVLRQLINTEILITNMQSENVSDKRYKIMFVFIALFSLIIFILF